MSKEKVQEFKKLTEPLMKWLNENHHPHSEIRITPTNAKLLCDEMSTGEVLDYVDD